MDMQWLATEAKTLHQIFTNSFFTLVLLFLTVGLILEYFKFPLGGTPQFPQLVGRVFISCLLLVAVPEVMNMLSSVTDSIVGDIGKLVEFKLVMNRLGDKLSEMSWSWVSVKDTVIIIISYLSFFLLYITVYMMDAFFMFSWMMLFVFSPLLMALYVFPMTASATTTFFKALVEVCVWKIIWVVLAALLWSMALSQINQPQANVSFLTVIILNLMLAFSVLMTPKITSSFLGGGISNMATAFGGAIMGAAALTPVGMIGKAKMLGSVSAKGIKNLAMGSAENKMSTQSAHRFHQYQNRRK
jgi:hypothetical protein